MERQRQERKRRSFAADDRAIEGLPIRLVIALVVGVAALGIMMTMLSGIGDFGTTEATVEYDDNPIDEGDDVTVSVVTGDGDPIEGATILVTSGDLTVPNAESFDADTGDNDNEAEISIGEADTYDVEVDFRTNQDHGTIEVEVIPPDDGDYDGTTSDLRVIA